MASEAQRAAIAKYISEKTVRYVLTMNKESESDLIQWLDGQPNKAQAIKNAIRASMNQPR